MHLICPPPPPPPPPPRLQKKKHLYKHCFQFLFGRLEYPGEMKKQRLCKIWGVGEGQIRCIIGDVPVVYEAGYKLHNNTMTYDKLINSPFVHALRIKRITYYWYV